MCEKCLIPIQKIMQQFKALTTVGTYTPSICALEPESIYINKHFTNNTYTSVHRLPTISVLCIITGSASAYSGLSKRCRGAEELDGKATSSYCPSGVVPDWIWLTLSLLVGMGLVGPCTYLASCVLSREIFPVYREKFISWQCTSYQRDLTFIYWIVQVIPMVSGSSSSR